MANNSDDILLNPKDLEAVIRKAGQSDSFKKWRRELEKGPHPTDEIIFDYANGTLDEIAKGEWFEHISHCPRCSQEVYSIRAKMRKSGKND